VSTDARTEPGADPTRTGDRVVEVRGVGKRYGGIEALTDVNLELRRGEILALVGDNGAGKSTLLKILSGNLAPTYGEVLVDGRTVHFTKPAEATAAGIATVYQDLALALDLDVVENMFLGREVRRRGLGRLTGHLDRAAMTRFTREALEKVHIRIPDVNQPVRSLSGGQRQAVAIARATTWCEHVLLLDEPTAALGVEQQREVLDLMMKIRRESGIAIILVSHQLPHVLEVADRIAVLRRGRIARVFDQAEATNENLISAITGLDVPQGA
jgi:ABC-type sugar transport system ATPase subunit